MSAAGERLVEVAVDAAGAGGAAVHVRRAGGWRISRTARPCSSSSVGGRRSGSCSARRGEAPGRRRPSPRRAGPRRRTAPAAADARAGALDRRALPRATGPRHPGDAAAGAAGAARAGRRADATPSRSTRGARRRRHRPSRPAGGRGEAGQGPCRARWPGRPAPPPSGPGVARPRHARLDAARCGRRASLRALGPAAAGGSCAAAAPSPPGSVRRAGPLVHARWPPSRSWRATHRRRTPRESRPPTWPDGTARRPWPRWFGAGLPRPASANDRAGRWPPERPARAAAGPGRRSCPRRRPSPWTASPGRSRSATPGRSSSTA